MWSLPTACVKVKQYSYSTSLTICTPPQRHRVARLLQHVELAHSMFPTVLAACRGRLAHLYVSPLLVHIFSCSNKLVFILPILPSCLAHSVLSKLIMVFIICIANCVSFWAHFVTWPGYCRPLGLNQSKHPQQHVARTCCYSLVFNSGRW